MAIISFDGFWKYYDATTRKDNSGYRKCFRDCFYQALVDMDMIDTRYPGDWPEWDWISKNATKICAKVRVKMLSKGVPESAVKQINEKFKKWVKEEK